MSEAYTAATKYINSWLSYYVERNNISGLSVAIRRKDMMLLESAYGHADIAKKHKMTTDHIFRIASHSKMFTAVAVLQLQEKEKLKIDDPIGTYIEWINDHSDKRWKKVTIRQLLSHGAGVIRDGLDADYWNLDGDFPDNNKLQSIIMQSDLIFDNNVQLKYSNIGYSLLGVLITNVSGQTYGEYVTEHIIGLLALQNTYTEYDALSTEKLATQYSRLDKDGLRSMFPHLSTHALAPATGLCSTPSDLSLFAAALQLGTGKLLDDESKKEMQRTAWKVAQSMSEEYGLGLAINNIGDKRYIGHGGGFIGHTSFTLTDPESGLIVVIAINGIGEVIKPLAINCFQILEWFQNAHVDKPTHDLTKFNGRFDSIWGESDIIAYGNSAITVWPGGWNPFADIAELEYFDEHNLKIVKTHGHTSPGELIEYVFDDKNVATSIKFAGMSMRPL